ncbi:MAG: transglycosylase SLT domain-containing protein [Actinomycetota bacterium]
MQLLRLGRARPLAIGAALSIFLVSGCGGPENLEVGDAAAPTAAAEQDAAPANDPDTTPATTDDEGVSSAADDDPEPTATAAVPPTATAEPESDTSAPPATAEPETSLRPAAPNGRAAPNVASTPEELAAQIASAEAGLADPASSVAARADWGHLHQVAIRKIGYEPDWDVAFFEALPSEYVERTLLHVSARRALIDLSSGYDAADFIPAWEIIEPESEAMLLEHYRAAEAATGIEWEYLAAINLVETGMGRIRGLSSAGAQGPMQFLPTTWAESGIGAGDINDPGDAIGAAARYLVRRGGPSDMPGAIWGYNNSDAYVTAIGAYAELLRLDPAAYAAIYHWEIYFFTEDGDVWLPTGFIATESIDLDEFLVTNPWSVPDPGLR